MFEVDVSSHSGRVRARVWRGGSGYVVTPCNNLPRMTFLCINLAKQTEET